MKLISILLNLLFVIGIHQANAQVCQTETTQADFLAGTANNVDLTSSAGDIKLSPILDQQNTTISGSGAAITITTYGGQTFTPAISGNLNKISINLSCNGCTGTIPNIVVEIRATASSLPTGAALATSSIAGFNSAAVDHVASFSTPPALIAGTMYAIVVHPSANPSPGTYALTRSANDVYAGGTRVSGTSGGTVWSVPLVVGASTDAGFKTYMTSTDPVSGDFTSQVKDAGAPVAWTTLSFTDDVPVNTNINFQVAASNNIAGPFAFVGPDGTGMTFFTTSGASLSQFSNEQYIQYKAFLSTSDGTVTPTLNDVAVCHASVVPVHWLNITGNMNNQNQPVITWQVEESNTANYEIEKSIDGITFTSIGTVDSRGNGTRSYLFTDQVNVPATAFYRIKQIDKNGRYIYSTIIKLSNHFINALDIYPNPTTSVVTLTAGRNLLNTEAVLTDVTGKTILLFTIKNISSRLHLDKYPNGVYVLKLANGIIKKIIKQ